MYMVSKKWYFVGKNAMSNFISNLSKIQRLRVFWKIQDIYYKMGTEILKTEKMKPEPPS